MCDSLITRTHFPQVLRCHATPGKSVTFLKGILPIAKFFTFCKPHIHGYVTSNRNVHPLYSCLSAIFKISLELTLFSCTQPYAIRDFDCICLSIHVVIKQHVHIHSFLLKTLWKCGTSSHYTPKSVFCRETSGIQFLLSQTCQNTLVYLTNH